ncbi:hypothetical protein P3X46_029033 [Hevea brasiliensis]|uniref:DUF3741 domain-containing protein n=1 Tax=Hevea brasiliensis TaxID=3981 RepID=A0ABQ9KU16_HEVBR|nr:uncharacterized protein LOC110666429 [Hevea brasiliensis]KAJ9146808.1 hypothetical protein P3X46_029033 [Hevea brasiliensis]
MKLLPSPSISSSSTTNSFHANMCTSKSATASCLAGILRRLLCSRSLPTHPSYPITDATSIPCHIKQQHLINSNESVPTAPGIVARLMGLECFPDSIQVSACSISRSQSMNSAEFGDQSDQKQGQHRRVKSTLSFCEMPTFIELENEEFFVLSFEETGESKETRSRGRKCEVGFEELREKTREKCKSKENTNDKVQVPLKKKKKKKKKNKDGEEIINKMILKMLNEEQPSKRIPDTHAQEIDKIEDSHKATLPLQDSCEKTDAATVLQEAKKSHWINDKDVPRRPKLTRKKKKINRCALKNEELEECSSEDSSPVSVLDFDRFMVDPEVPLTEEDKKSISRRKLSSTLHDYDDLSEQNEDNNFIGEDHPNSKRKEEACGGLRKKIRNAQHFLNMWSEICKLAEAQLLESNSTYEKIWKSKDVEDIGADLGMQILDQLLEELVDQLCLPGKNLNLQDDNFCKF